MSDEIVVVDAATVHEAPIADIYNHYVATTVITFEETPVGVGEMAARIQEVHKHELPWLVAEQAGDVLGYAYADRWKARAAYRRSVEITVYVADRHRERRVGSLLYEALFARLAERSIHAVIAGIALPNDASVALHEKFGMRKVAHFSEVGFKFGRWVDVGYWQRTL